jgi:hypothetical protein
LGYSNNTYKIKRFIPIEGSFVDLTYDEVYAVIDWLKIELTERQYPNYRYPDYPIKKLAVRQPTRILTKRIINDSLIRYYISWNFKSYNVETHMFPITPRDEIKLLEFNDYFDFNHENRGKKLKRFGI